MATDHAPHAQQEKEVPFEAAPFGTTGLETAFAALYSGLVLTGELPLPVLVTRMSQAPATLAGLPAPTIAAGVPADLCLVDVTTPWTVAATTCTRGRPTPPGSDVPSRDASVSPSPQAASPTTTVPSPALVVLEDGAAFRGEAMVGSGTVGGEIVFNTAMTGYQEIATDPSYCGQIVTYTFPLNGDYGADPARDESDRAHARAIVARELVNYAFNRASSTSWLDWLSAHGVLAVSGVDTRALTRHIRSRGALRAVVSTDDPDVGSLRKRAQRLPRMAGLDLASAVTRAQPAESPTTAEPADGGPPLHVVALDFGIKRSIVGYLAAAGCRTTVVPAGTAARDILRLAPDGVFLSNGPGDPAAVGYAVKTVQQLLGKTPLFGICLGHQLLALALGMPTYKLKFGHRGGNHPVQDLGTGRVESRRRTTASRCRRPLIEAWRPWVTHINLNDGTVEGIAAPARDVFSVQYHPERRRAARLPLPVRRASWPSAALRRRACARRGGGGLAVPRRDDLHKILHRLRADRHRPGLRVRLLRHAGLQGAAEEGFEVVLVNSNPATIMTDPDFADAHLHRAARPGHARRRSSR